MLRITNNQYKKPWTGRQKYNVTVQTTKINKSPNPVAINNYRNWVNMNEGMDRGGALPSLSSPSSTLFKKFSHFRGGDQLFPFFIPFLSLPAPLLFHLPFCYSSTHECYCMKKSFVVNRQLHMYRSKKSSSEKRANYCKSTFLCGQHRYQMFLLQEWNQIHCKISNNDVLYNPDVNFVAKRKSQQNYVIRQA